MRLLDPIEGFFKSITDLGAPINREQWAISMALKLKFPSSAHSSDDQAQYLQRSWLALCHHYPVLTGSVSASSSSTGLANPDFRLIVKPLVTAEDDTDWLARTFSVHETSSADQLFTSTQKTGLATCSWLPQSQTLHIREMHWRNDGVGMMLFADAFMKTLTLVLRLGLKSELKAYTADLPYGGLSSSFEEVFGLYNNDNETPPGLLSMADEYIKDFIAGNPSIGLPTTVSSGDDDPPGNSLRETVSSTLQETSAILSSCKIQGLNVPSAIQAALVTVTAAFPQDPRSKSYTVFFPVDYRRHIPPAHRDHTGWLIKTACIGLPIRIQDVKAKTYGNISKEIAAFYKAPQVNAKFTVHGTTAEGETLSLVNLLGPYQRRLNLLFAAPPPPELPRRQTPEMSTLGNVEQYLKREYGDGDKKVVVNDFWLGTQFILPALQCHVWTFRDKLTIQACFNETYYNKSFVASFLADVRSEVLVGLGIA